MSTTALRRLSHLAVFVLLLLASPSGQAAHRHHHGGSIHSPPALLLADPLATRLHELEDAHYQAEWQEDPVNATLSGIHAGDGRLPAFDDTAFRQKRARLMREAAALHRLDLSAAPLREQDDRLILLSAIRKECFTLDDLQPDRHQPAFALSIITNGLGGLVAQDYAPLAERMKAANNRLAQVPAFLQAARLRWHQVPAIHVELALEDLAGARSFLLSDLPLAFAPVQDQALQQEFTRRNRAALTALDAYATALHRLVPEGGFALGRRKMMKLLASDMIDLPPEAIMKAGEARLDRDVRAFRETAQHINPAHPEEAFLAIQQDHPTAGELIPTIRQQLHEAQTFLLTHHIVPLPSQTLPIVRDTPAFEQSLTTAATEWAGPFEHQRLPSYYDVTPPPPHASALQRDMILADFNRPALLNITVHEALPGHFVQGLYLQAHPQWSPIRKDAASYTTTEGWAHYGEQMMIEQAFQQSNPAYRLMQLQDALLRDCRLLAAFGLHTQGMTLNEAEELMGSRCLQSATSAHKEARRGAADPDYFSYTLGKLMILHLREDMQRQQGSGFSLERFHDGFLKAGLVPMRIIRRELTGKDGPLL